MRAALVTAFDRPWSHDDHDHVVGDGGRGDDPVTIADRLDDETDRHVAKVLAEAVPGVVRAQIGDPS